MLDKLVEKALNAGYGEIVASLVAVMATVITYYVLRHIKRYDKVHDAVFGKEGLHSSVKTINQRLDSHDKTFEQVIDSIKTLVDGSSEKHDKTAKEISKVKADTAYIRGWIEGQADKDN